MSSGTTLTMYRRFNNAKFSLDIIGKLREFYTEKYEKENSWKPKPAKDPNQTSAPDRKECFPRIVRMNRYEGPICDRDLTPDDFTYVDMATSTTLQKMISVDFPSTFSQLKEEYRLNSYDLATSSTLIERSDAENILVAVKYLLLGKYSKEMEDVMDNRFIKILGDSYPRYINRKMRENIYLDKNGEDGYVLSIGDADADRTNEDENLSAEYCLRSLQSFLTLFLEASEDNFYGYDTILEITAW